MEARLVHEHGWIPFVYNGCRAAETPNSEHAQEIRSTSLWLTQGSHPRGGGCSIADRFSPDLSCPRTKSANLLLKEDPRPRPHKSSPTIPSR
ncbi:hypothetical protein AVEN_198312-1 [Araneus ventricosus]|uniref:Uncharacterized protein n=1 Tax=Araneus ventricosus TaxID=182803 RepID=A0A4Y2RK04_ARAVE|nr:hypothetical protein AVEN_198312-1 [Araneus ventricosus]